MKLIIVTGRPVMAGDGAIILSVHRRTVHETASGEYSQAASITWRPQILESELARSCFAHRNASQKLARFYRAHSLD